MVPSCRQEKQAARADLCKAHAGAPKTRLGRAAQRQGRSGTSQAYAVLHGGGRINQSDHWPGDADHPPARGVACSAAAT